MSVQNCQTPFRLKQTLQQRPVVSTSAALVSCGNDAGWRCHRVTSPVAKRGCGARACGQEHFLPTSATAVELMRNPFLKTVKLRVHAALRQHATRFFLTGRQEEGRPLWFVITHLSVRQNSSYWLSLPEPIAANANTLPLPDVDMTHVSNKIDVLRFSLSTGGLPEVSGSKERERRGGHSPVGLQT